MTYSKNRDKPSKIRSRLEGFQSWLRQFSLPGFQGVSVFFVILFFIRGFQKGTLVTRASAIAFNIMIAILPSMIFLFTLIPFIPIENFQTALLEFFYEILPQNAFILLENTLIQVITEKSGGLLLLMFLATLLFSTNGIHALINAFNVSTHEFQTRSWISQRVTSLFLIFLIAIMMAVSILIILIGKTALTKLVEMNVIELNFNYYLLSIAKWIIFLALIYFVIASLYYEIPADKEGWTFFSPGSIVATLLFVLSSLGFSIFVNNFGQFNKLYGSIGTLMVILIWLYFNSINLLIGFELNVSIRTANRNKDFLKPD